MPTALIVFGTTDGHTAKIASALAVQLRSVGYTVSVVDAAGAETGPIAFDAVIVAASVHARGYQHAVQTWVRKHAASLNRLPTAFVSVCLGVLQHDPKVDSELQAIINEFLESTAWKPSATKIVAGALKYTQYGFLKRWAMKRIVTKAGGDTDTSRDYEYTDWEDLARFARTFAASLQTSSAHAHTA